MRAPITWEISHETLFLIFLSAFFLGVITGIFGEISRFQREVFPLKRIPQGILTGFADFFLLLFAAVTAAILLYALNFGQMRAEVPILQLLGFVSWRKSGGVLFGSFYRKISKKHRRL